MQIRDNNFRYRQKRGAKQIINLRRDVQSFQEILGSVGLRNSIQTTSKVLTARVMCQRSNDSHQSFSERIFLFYPKQSFFISRALAVRSEKAKRTQTSSAGSSTLTENSEHALILMCFLENERKNRKHIVKSDSSARTSSDSTHFFLLAFCHRSLDEPKKTAPNKHRDCSCDLEIFSSERDRLGMAGGGSGESDESQT